MKFLVEIIVLISVSFCIVQSAIIQNCGSEVGVFTDVEVTDCSEKQERCILKRGTNATITIAFKLNTEIEKEVKAVCFGKLGSLDVPFKLPNPDGCQNSGIECPLQRDISYSYKATFPILKIYPKLDVIVKYELQNSEKKNIVCVEIPVKIV